MDVGEWLRSLGLSQYEALFRRNDIDAEVLSELTDGDLEKFGVSFGHRKRLLKAIASLGSTETAAKPAIPAPAPAPNSTDVAERRQLTVMFCDLVGSTALSTRLDPEDLREVIGSYHRCCANCVERNGGFVAKYMGDGVLAYFGYPRADEHDAENAVRAGLAIVDAAPKLQTLVEEPLHVRVGIATGIVVVGDLLGSGDAQERGVVGDTPNLAARLQGIAEPDTVVIAQGTRNLIGGLFDLQDLGPQALKGVPGETRALVAIGKGVQESRFEALHASGMTELIGREEQCELLLRCWAKSKGGDGQVVILAGEPGIGKSRLTMALLERIAAEPHMRLRYFCSPQHTYSSLYPMVAQLERGAGFAREDTAGSKLDKLDGLLARTATSQDDAAIIAEMLSLPNDGRYPALDLAPRQRRQRTLQALTDQIEKIARRCPLLIVFEDAHWSDPSSLELLDGLVDGINALPILLCVTSRPEFAAPWIGRPHVSALRLDRLAPGDAIAIIDRIAGARSIPENIREYIVERTDGVPLFVEEMTKAVLEVKGEALGKTAGSVPSPAQAVPSSLHASLMARLDRLGDAKAVAQIGAAIGREFSHALLASVAQETDAEFGSSLERLIEAGLLLRRGGPPDATYSFKHALVQDTAYGTLLREPRRALHARIVNVLERQFSPIAEGQPELLAHHCVNAGLFEKAVSYWGKAAQRALGRSALIEAISLLRSALKQTAALASTPAMRREQINLQIALIGPLMHINGYGAQETIAAAERARLLIEESAALGEPLDDPLLLFSVLYSFWVANYVAFDGDAVRLLATQFLTFAQRQTEAPPLMMGHRLMGTSLLLPGDIVGGRQHYDHAVALYDPSEHRSLAARFGQDPRVATLCFRSLALWMLGHPDAGLRDAEDALRDAAQMDHAATLMLALFHISFFRLLRRDYVETSRLVEQLFTLTAEKSAVFWRANGTIMQGCALALSNQPEDAVKAITSGIAAFQSTGARVWLPMYLACLAIARAQLGEFENAWRCIDEATTAVAATKERWCEAEIYRIAGEITLTSPKPDTRRAAACFQRALDIARTQQARSWELRAATSLSRLCKDEGRRSEARAALEPVYGWFTEGFETPDLKEAKAQWEALA